MAFFKLNCPRCRKRLVHVPHEGLTLHYRCAEHGTIILRPLEEIDEERDETFEVVANGEPGGASHGVTQGECSGCSL